MALILLLLSLTVPTAQADGGAPVDLVMGGQGSLPWSVTDLRPGDRGSEAVELTNMGDDTAYLRVWVSGIEETDRYGDGAALAGYLRFALVADGLTTTMDMPATIDRFPASPTDRGQLVIGPLAAGGSASLRWTWEFEESGEPQNDAQGDGLSFSISYMLTDAPPPAAAYKYVAVDMMGWQSVLETDSSGVVQHDTEATDPLGVHRLIIAAGTRVVDEEGSVPGRIVLSNVFLNTPSGPPGSISVSPLFALRGYHADGSEVNLTFSQPATMVIGINASVVPIGYLPMGVHSLNGGSWSRLPAAGGELTRWSAGGEIDRTGVLAVFAAPVETGGASLHVTDLDVRPLVQDNGWPVAISTTVGRSVAVTAYIDNLGNLSGIYRVDLIIDGSVRDTVTVVAEPGETLTVSMSASGIEDGEHMVTVLDMTSRFRTGTTVDWALIIISNATVLSSLVIVRQRHLVARPARSVPGAARRVEIKDAPSVSAPPEAANPEFLNSISEVWEARRAGSKEEPPAPAQAEAANPQFLESIGEVWEARRTAEQVVERRLRRGPGGKAG